MTTVATWGGALMACAVLWWYVEFRRKAAAVEAEEYLPLFNWRRMLTNLALRLVAKRPAKPGNTVADLRRKMSRFDKPFEGPADFYYRKEILADLECEWFQPQGVADDAPLIVHFPGGGFILAAMNGHRQFLVDVCRTQGCRALLAQYRLAPEFPLPVAQIDGLRLYKHLLESLEQDPAKLFLMGDSAGGNVVLSTLLQARDQGLALPAAGILISAGSDLTLSCASTLENMDKDPMFHINNLHWILQQAIPVEQATNDPLISPTLGNYTGLPPLLFEVGSSEIMRDHSILAAENARRDGVEVQLTISPHSPHAYPLMKFLPEARAARARIVRFMGRLSGPVDTREQTGG
jgi:acetyl esterase/lipase